MWLRLNCSPQHHSGKMLACCGSGSTAQSSTSVEARANVCPVADAFRAVAEPRAPVSDHQLAGEDPSSGFQSLTKLLIPVKFQDRSGQISRMGEATDHLARILSRISSCLQGPGIATLNAVITACSRAQELARVLVLSLFSLGRVTFRCPARHLASFCWTPCKAGVSKTSAKAHHRTLSRHLGCSLPPDTVTCDRLTGALGS